MDLRRRVVLAIGVLAGTSLHAAADEVAPASAAKIAVLGDSLADGLWGALYRKLYRDKRYSIYRGAKNSVGFGSEDLIDMIEKAFATSPPDAVVMMIGANDRRGIYVDGKLEAAYRSPQWPDAYQRRVERFMDHVASRGAPLVWVLLPVMREDDATRDARQINNLIRAAAESRVNVRLIETWTQMSDEQGNYTAYAKDAKRQSRLLRHTDGVHFSEWGYEIMADAALKELLAASPVLSSITSVKASAP